jgi:predicted RNA-binding protein with PUA-like domain
MAFWLVKSEPVKYAWDQFVKDGQTRWDGVRNYQAAKNLKSMKIGDQAFFYHSNEGLAIVGIAEVVGEAEPDPSDATGRFVLVTLRPLRALPRPVTLAELKADPDLSTMALIRQSRLSVSPVTDAEWRKILTLTIVGG